MISWGFSSCQANSMFQKQKAPQILFQKGIMALLQIAAPSVALHHPAPKICCEKIREKKTSELEHGWTWDTPRFLMCTFHADFDHLTDYIDILSIGCLNHQFLSRGARPLLHSPWGRQRFGVSDHRGLLRSICPRRAVGNSATHHKSSTTVWIQLNVGHNGVFMAKDELAVWKSKQLVPTVLLICLRNICIYIDYKPN